MVRSSGTAHASRLLNALPIGVTLGLAAPNDQEQIVALLEEQGVCQEGLDYREFGAGGTTFVATVNGEVIALLSGHLSKPCSWVTELASRKTLRLRTRVALAVALMRVWEEAMRCVGSQAWVSVCDQRLPEIAHLTEWYGASAMGTTTIYQRRLEREERPCVFQAGKQKSHSKQPN